MPSARLNIQLPDMWVVCVWPGRRHECVAKDMSGTNRTSRSQGGPLKVKELEVGGEGAPPSCSWPVPPPSRSLEVALHSPKLFVSKELIASTQCD